MLASCDVCINGRLGKLKCSSAAAMRGEVRLCRIRLAFGVTGDKRVAVPSDHEPRADSS